MKRYRAHLWILLCVPVLLTGCYRAHQLESLCEDLAWQYPEADFHREISFSLGSISLGAAKMAAGFSDDTREAREYMMGLKRIDVAVYEVSHLGNVKDATLPEPLSDLIEDDWEIVVKVREDDERVWILYREDDNRIRDIHITVLDPDELVMVRMSGDLTETFERVLDDHSGLTAAIHR